jgi:DNA-binding CsgD family transcriptional regulator
MAGAFRCATLVGRQSELELVTGLILRVSQGGSGGCVVLVGEPGVGKSRLASEAARRALAQSLAVLAGRGSVVAGGASLLPVAEAVSGYAHSAPVPPDYLSGYLPVLARFAPSWGVPAGPESSPVLVGEALLRLAEGQPAGTLLVLEDLHWADPDTLRVVEYVAEHCASSRTVFLVTTRPSPAAATASAVVQGLARRSHADVRTLARLNPAEAEAVAEACLAGGDPLAPEVRELVAAAEGLPLLVEDLLAAAAARDVLRRGPEGWTLTDQAVQAPPSFADSVATRLAALEEPAGAVLRAAAVLGRDFDEHLLSSVAGLPSQQVATALREGEAAQLVEADSSFGANGTRGHRFRHALTREAILAGIPAAERSTLAAVAATASVEAGASADVCAALYALAGRHDDAARLLVDAAETERRIGTREAGVALLARARSLAKDPAVARDVAVAQVALLAESGLARDALRVAREVLPFLPASESRAIRLRLASAALQAQDPSGARAQLDAALSGGDLSDMDWATVWSLEAGLALADSSPERVREAEQLAHRAVAAAKLGGQPSVHCDSLLVLGRCARLRDLAAAEDAFRNAFSVADAAGLVIERVNALAELGTVQMLREVRADTLEQAQSAAEVVGAPMTAAGIGVNLAGVRIMRGELDMAVTTSRATQYAARRLGLDGALWATTMLEGVAHGLAGRPEEMERLLTEAETGCGGEPDVVAGSWAIGRATVALLDEDRDRAKRSLRRAHDVIRRSPVLMIDPASGPAILLAAFERSTSHPEIDEAERRSGLGSAWTRMWIESARAVHAGATGEGDPEPSGRAGLEAASRYPVFGLVASRLVAEAQLRDRWGEPLPLLDSLEAQARAGGHHRLAAACRSLQRSAGVRVPRRRAVDAGLPEALQRMGITAREAEVLELLPERLTNPQIAKRLFLSPRTVEKHVSSLLTKTGARSRAELAEVARDPHRAPAIGKIGG